VPDHDVTFAAAIARGNVVTAFTVASGASSPPAAPFRIALAGPDPAPLLSSYPAAITTLPGLEAGARGNGAINFRVSHDGVIRQVPLLFSIAGRIYPSLAAEALRIAQGAQNYVIKVVGTGAGDNMEPRDHRSRAITAVRIGRITVPTDSQGQVALHYTRRVPERYVPAWRVLDGSKSQGALAGHIFLIGTSAQGLQDLRFDPVNGIVPGVEIHAQAIEQMIQGSLLLRPDWAAPVEVVFLLVAAALAIVLGARLGAIYSALSVALLLGAAILGSWYAFAELGLLLDPAFAGFTVVAAYLFASVLRLIQTERERHFVRSAFASYVSPNLVQHLLANPASLRPGGERRDATLDELQELRGRMSLARHAAPTTG